MARSIGVVLVLAAGVILVGGCSGGGGDGDGAHISFVASAFSVNEDGTPIMEITLERTGPTGGTISATVVLTDGTATGGTPPLVPPADYDNTPVVVTWLANDTADKVVTVMVLDDPQDEPDETVNLSLANFSGASGGAIVDAVLTIVDDDIAGSIQFSQAFYSYGEDGTPFSAITIERVGGMDGAVSASIVSTDGTANSDPNSLVEPLDFIAINSLVMWADQDTTPIVFVLNGIQQDLLPEADEDFTLTIVSTTGGALIGSPSVATVTIFDDDVSLEIANPSPSVNALFGSSVAKAGRHLVIGSPNSNAPSGLVYFIDPSVGTPDLTLTEPFAQQFGTKVIVDGQTLAVGSSGNVYVYGSDGSSVSPRFDVTSGQPGFGSTGIGLMDGRLAIGAPGAQLGGSVSPSGQVYVYDATTGTPLQTLDGSADNEFGSSFGFFNGALLIGSPGNTGLVQSFTGTPLALSFTVANPVPNAVNPSPSFGAAVGSINMSALVGAPDEDTLVADAGVLYMFDGGPANAILAPGAFVAGGRFGAQILTIGSRICVQQQGGGASACGRVFVLDFNGGLVQTIDDPNPSPNADFGAAMCEFDGALVIAAPKQGALLQPGSVFIFKIN